MDETLGQTTSGERARTILRWLVATLILGNLLCLLWAAGWLKKDRAPATPETTTNSARAATSP